MDTENPETLLNTKQWTILLWGGEIISQRFLALPDMVACVAFEWCSMEELLCHENRSCGEATPQGTVAKDRSNFHLTWYDPFGSLDCNSHYVQTDIVQLFFLTVFCSLKIYFSAALMVFVEVLGNPFPLRISSAFFSLSLVRRKHLNLCFSAQDRTQPNTGMSQLFSMFFSTHSPHEPLVSGFKHWQGSYA